MSYKNQRKLNYVDIIQIKFNLVKVVSPNIRWGLNFIFLDYLVFKVID